jgi:hypothetical protein
MSRLSLPNKIFLEATLGMGGGYVLDFSNNSFANFFGDLNIDIYDEEKYPGFGDSKANRMRALWKSGSDAEVSSSLIALADYIEARQSTSSSLRFREDISGDQIALLRKVAVELGAATSERTEKTGVTDAPDTTPAIFTTEATVSKDKLATGLQRMVSRRSGV